MNSATPSIKSGAGVTIINHVEEVATLSVNNTVTPQILQCIPSVLPNWLRGVAANWSKWHWDVLRFVYVPICSTSVSGSFHMGFLYDQTDVVPTTVGQMTSLKGYTTGPVWSGQEGSVLLNYLDTARPCPPGAICASLDTGNTETYWYPYVTTAQLTAELAVASVLGNMRTPARLAIITSDGAATANVACGRLYAVYRVRLVEPVPSALNV